MRPRPGAERAVVVDLLLDVLWLGAATLYRAPLPDGKAFEDCEDYEAWLAARERIHDRHS